MEDYKLLVGFALQFRSEGLAVKTLTQALKYNHSVMWVPTELSKYGL